MYIDITNIYIYTMYIIPQTVLALEGFLLLFKGFVLESQKCRPVLTSSLD